MKFALEDRRFWPEIPLGTLACIHKRAVMCAWAQQGVTTELLAFARVPQRWVELTCDSTARLHLRTTRAERSP